MSVDWRELALFLADCQAATSERELSLRSGSKGEKRRHRDICLLALGAMNGTQAFASRTQAFASRNADAVKDRLQRVADTEAAA